MKLREVFALAIAIAVSEAAGAFGAIFTTSAISGWYANLIKPPFTPPAWLFGPVWGSLYLLMGVAAFFIWRSGWERREVKIALGIFVLQLVLNALWSFFFFGLESPGLALFDIFLLWLAIAWTMVAFCKISHKASFFLIPYIVWVSYAAFLNYAIWIVNG